LPLWHLQCRLRDRVAVEKLRRSLREAIQELKARLGQAAARRFPISGLKGAAFALLLREAALALEHPILAVVPTAREAEGLVAEVALFMGESADSRPLSRRVHLLPAWESAPLAPVSPSVNTQAAQFVALLALLRTPHPLVVTSVDALMTRTLARPTFSASLARISPGERLDLEGLIDALSEAGYQRVPQVEEVGDFSVRGGIVDIFSPAHKEPFRLELDGETVASLRYFELGTQRSLQPTQEVYVISSRYVAAKSLKDHKLHERVGTRAAEIGLLKKELAEINEALENGLLFPGVERLLPYIYPAGLDSLFAYLPENTLVWMQESGRVLAEAGKFAERVAQEAERCQNVPVFYPEPQLLYLSLAELEQALDRLPAVQANSLTMLAAPREGYAPPIEVECKPSLKLTDPGADGRKVPSFEPLVTELKEIQRAQGRAVMVVEGQSQSARLRRHLEAYEIAVNDEPKRFSELCAESDLRPAILAGEIGAGCALALDGIYIYSEEDLFGESRVHRRARPRSKGLLTSLTELTPGTHVVHLDHGIGLYRGLTHLRVSGAEGDFLNIGYADDQTLYVPVERINLVQRYVGGDGGAPKLDRLGSGSWEKVKRRTKQALLAMAAELLEVHAAREIEEGHAFALPPDHEYEEFVSRFEFEETPDQQAAIDDVISDMTSSKPMDRLICGDAGFGKTEVALRAAFVAAMEGSQVAMLAPTTVLAEQHFNTFVKRFKGFPVRIGMLSRFVSAKESRVLIEELKSGRLDIVIGTHRLLQSDVQFRRLGLLIIDEEQRFGVRHKERIKKLRKLIDVLTLAATPIPRTLQMAMVGIRDLSVIQTPPLDRQSVRTFVAHFDDGLIREAALRELNRGGQVFFVHNRVENIYYIARHLRALLPEAKIAVAHGQMAEDELERVMREFVTNQVNLLVCSAIIESGLDIPNANTIIINRADHFGLAQLYQLRGRVGRSRNKAYAYLLIPGEHLITREAKRRIELFCELDELGSGFKIALHDLELRGAGNLLGHEQSGNITAVGFELYMEMLEQAVNELRGKPPRAEIEPELQLGVPAYIPQAFVADESERLVLYRRLARVDSAEELDDLRAEMRDRFGPLPTLVENLFRIMNLRRRMRALMIVNAHARQGTLELRFHPQAPIDGERLAALVNVNRRRLRLGPDLKLSAQVENRNYEELFDEVEAVLDAVDRCVAMQPDEKDTNGARGYLN
jgi:transcription-repair coupling factor (superfamily II helicase)